MFVPKPFPSKSNQGPLEKWLILELGEETHKMILKHFEVPEIKEVFKLTTTMWVCQRDRRAN